MATVITAGTTKGGVGKTTTVQCLAVHLAARGARVGVVDADMNMTCAKWLVLNGYSPAPTRRWFEDHYGEAAVETAAEAARGRIALRERGVGEIALAVADDETVHQEIGRLKAASDHVLVDLEGTPNQAMLIAFGMSDLVIVPSQPSRYDIEECEKTVAQIERAAALVGRTIPRRVLLARTPPLGNTHAHRHSKSEFAATGFPMLPVELIERTAFRDMTFTGLTPTLADPEGAAAANVVALADAVLAALAEGGGKPKRRSPPRRQAAPAQ